MRPSLSRLVDGSVGKGQQRRPLSLSEAPQAAVFPESSDTPASGPRWPCLQVSSRTRSDGQVRGVSGRQVSPGQAELPLVGTAGSHGDLDAADRGGDLCADLEQFESDGTDGGPGQAGRSQRPSAQGLQQHMDNGLVRWEINGESRTHYFYAVEVDNDSNDETLAWSVNGSKVS